MHRLVTTLALLGLLLPGSLLAEPGGFFAIDSAPLPRQLLVDFSSMDPTTLESLAGELGVALRYNSAFSDAGEDLAVLEVADEAALQRLQALFTGRDDVEGAEPNRVYRGLWSPDDPLYKHQWHMDMIHMAEVWGTARGRGVTVAIIDTGVSSGDGTLKPVEDLTGARFVAGYDFVHDDDHADDDHAHGTHVAGTVAQLTDNGTGVAGVAFEARIMPIKVLDRLGRGYISDIAEGIRWAANHGADVINMSLGGPLPSLALAKAVAYARSKGVVVVCAAGNSGHQGVGYPAAHRGAIAVSALGPDEKLAFYSSWGKQVALAAPGGDTRVDRNNDGIPDGVLQNTIVPGDPGRQGYFPFQGTSMASPHVAGVAALVVGQGITNPARVESVLRGTTKNLGDAKHYGAGLIDAEAAVSRAIWRPGLLRVLLAGLLAAFVLRSARRKNSTAAGVSPGFLLGLVVAASGLFFLRFLETWFFGAFALTRPLLEWPGALLGFSWHLHALVGSALPALVLSVLFYSFKPLRPLAAGLAIGMSAYLLACAIDGSVNVRWVPGIGLFDRFWLVGNALLALLFGRISLPDR